MTQETDMQGSTLEQRIDYQALLLHTVHTRTERRAAWEELRRLIAQRSPERVEQMEREQGIR